MTIARELVTLIRYQLDESGLRKANAATAAVGAAARGAQKGVEGLGEAADRTGTSFGRLGGLVRGLLAGLSVLSAAKMADEWAGVEGRVSLVTDGIEDQTKALNGLYDAAQRSRQSYTGIAQTFQAVARNRKELELTTDDALKLSETIGTALTIGGGSGSSQEAALVQLGQALGSGTLRGDELNSVMEQAPRLAQAIAEAMNVPIGKLRDMGKEGKITSKALAKGLLKQSEKLRSEFEKMPVTFSGAWQMLSNALGRQIDKLNKSSGAAKVFYRVTNLIIDNLETIIKYVALIGGAALLTKFSMAARAMAASGGLLANILKKFGGAHQFGVLVGTFIRMLAVATALYYVFDDIQVFFEGGDSLLGRIIGPMEEWQWLVDLIKGGLTFIKDTLGGTAQSLGDWLSKWGLIGTIIAGIVAAIGAIPALIVSGIVAWASVFNYVRKNWDSLVEDTLYNLGRIKQYLLDLIPQSVRTFFGTTVPNFFSDKGKAGTASDSLNSPGAFTNGGGAAFVSPRGIPLRPGAAAGGANVSQTANVTINGVAGDPQAVAAAASRGTQRGLGAAMVPQVEAPR